MATAPTSTWRAPATRRPSAQGLNLLRKLGTYVEYSVFGSDVSVDWSIISDDKELDVLGAHLGPHTWPAAVRMLESGILPMDEICTHQLPLADFQHGLDLVGQRQGVGQGVAHPVSAIGRSIDPADRPVWIGTSWKMTKTLAAGPGLRRPGRGRADTCRGACRSCCPPHTALATVRERLPRESPILLGAQNAHWAPRVRGPVRSRCGWPRMPARPWSRSATPSGASTSQRPTRRSPRRLLRPSQHGLVPLICVGEPLSVRDAGQAGDFVAARCGRRSLG